MRYLVALLLVAVLVFAPVPAHAEKGCIINVAGIQICGELLEPLPTVTLPPLPPVTVTDVVTIKPAPEQVPGPTETVTIEVPSEGKTVFITGPAATETVTEGRTPQAVPNGTDTATVTEESTVTVTESPETVTAAEGESPGTEEEEILPELTLPETVGISALALLALCALLILGLWLGYILGYKDSARKEMKFLDALRDQFYYKGKHS